MSPDRAQVWYVSPSSSLGWAPVTALAHLVATLWETEVVEIHPTRGYGMVRKLASMLPRRRGAAGALLIIAAHPGDLLSLSDVRVLLGRFSLVGAWVIDSFWDERIPRFARTRRTIDRVWVTDAELVDTYSDTMHVPCGWAPWGTDALGWPGSRGRDIDVLRLGRQPVAWDDDESNQTVLADLGLRYQGRFPADADGVVSQRIVTDYLSRSKVVLASSNLASAADYTHPTRDYLTARFTDAVGCGAMIAGQFPAVRAATLIPQMARVEIDVTDRNHGLEALVRASAQWSPQIEESLRTHALKHLDWRHRIRQISHELGISTPTMTLEMARLDKAIRASEEEA